MRGQMGLNPLTPSPPDHAPIADTQFVDQKPVFTNIADNNNDDIMSSNYATLYS